jgi:hypothetical protein
MALSFKWDLWGESCGVLTDPNTLRVERADRHRLIVYGLGRWSMHRNATATYMWLQVHGESDELAELSDELLIDLVKVRYGTAI